MCSRDRNFKKTYPAQAEGTGAEGGAEAVGHVIGACDGHAQVWCETEVT